VCYVTNVGVFVRFRAPLHSCPACTLRICPSFRVKRRQLLVCQSIAPGLPWGRRRNRAVGVGDIHGHHRLRFCRCAAQGLVATPSSISNFQACFPHGSRSASGAGRPEGDLRPGQSASSGVQVGIVRYVVVDDFSAASIPMSTSSVLDKQALVPANSWVKLREGRSQPLLL
jgi:hypothetical protein